MADVQGGCFAGGNPYLNFFRGFEYEPTLVCAAMTFCEEDGGRKMYREGVEGGWFFLITKACRIM